MPVNFIDLGDAVREITDVLPLSIFEIWKMLKKYCDNMIGVIITEDRNIVVDISQYVSTDLVSEIASEVRIALLDMVRSEPVVNYDDVVETLKRVVEKLGGDKYIEVIDMSDGKTGWLFLISIT